MEQRLAPKPAGYARIRQGKRFEWFPLVNAVILILISLICVLPLIHIIAVSFSSSAAASAGYVRMWPVDFTFASYMYTASRNEFWQAMLVSLTRIGLGTPLNLLLTILVAYPLAKESHAFRFRSLYAWLFFITMLFNGGLIPWYSTIKEYGLLDSIWALILPGAVPVFSVVLLLNFFREIPKELEEAALIDGASHWRTMWSIFVPISKPALATLALFSMVEHWNSWFDGLLLMGNPSNYPLQSYIQTIVIQQNLSNMSRDDMLNLALISDRTLKSSQIFLGSLPIILAYPFLQKYFVKGIVLGSVKG
ncbi:MULTISPECIES: carbohydrate ABC transporter permease [Paenibacillus]|uniref:Binding--dependent transport system inner membrane component family protein n=1 Tax=Paenibacillus macerans TaxID=44252 RepID=A0A090ZCU8_PAEMA|nr:binding--dependent transport system inner membrane component family protein [Paenibacillus macerans]GBK61475.1 carbohydrate ABC transporter permease [Paenibacillus macerans]GBK67778.1 carbohydrate ABC transporter permease [Paenibacillus macerans]GIP10640.1 protein LplC [Paenibacillus macerans]SUA83036.1 binding-protein-dependent transport system inner membrane protein [Paenibacillus macerans]